ncbi:WD and tetratricopeptide repeats protein 1-like isoform X9 [Durio zibethinus]|uniref:WD and tetratricopeptide repeats protein 1-like isoform X9 n=1 Tax=Durio zibethinus TaxID=66656 RepID=A0A6P5Y7D2_DURZI|nr:WD and tetratricopeptide repeats protein 1-like isoform X9 [Durio zibethinus]
MEEWPFHDGNVHNLLESRHIDIRQNRHDVDNGFQMHSSLIGRLSLERELEGHRGCVNAVAWNSNGSLLISGSDDELINIWSYSGRKLLHSIETGHSANIFCTKFIPETSDELVVSGAGDAEVRLFNLSHLNGRGLNDGAISPSALYQCHTRRVKKLAVEVGNPNVVWSASEDGTLRQHDFREGTSCPPAGSSRHECRNVLLDLRCGAKRSLADPPGHTLALKSCDISSTRPHLLLVGGNDAFARLYDRRMLPPLTSCRKRSSPPPCVNYFCPMHLSDHGHSSLHLTHVTFSPNGEEVLLSYSGEHVYLMNINHASGSLMQYSSGDASKLMTFTPVLNRLEHQPLVSNVFQNGLQRRNNIAARIEKCRMLVEMAKRSLQEGTNIFHAIEACNEVFDGHATDIGPTLRHECFCTRAALLLKRKWKNDAHIAVRDCHSARRIDSSSFRAHYCMAEALQQPEAVIDMKQRYVGHCNVGTDIKQASFLGQRGEYVASGSDDGRWFIWEKRTGRLIKMLLGDDAVVNCVQCHPFDCFVATSGIDNTIKLWTAAGGSAGPETSVLEAMESNQRKLCHNREAFLNVICRPFELLERFRMQEFSEGPLHPFECAQS